MRDGYSMKFYGFEGSYSSYYPAYSGRTFGMYVTAHGRSYLCLFDTNGALLSCTLSGS